MSQHNAAEEPRQEGDSTQDIAARLAELEKKLAEAHDKMLRALAEGENIRKRSERERQDTAKFAVSSFARDLLGVADNLRRALSSISPEAREKSVELKNIYAGVEMTEKELLRVFESNGIKRLDPVGAPFDPNLHEVLFEGEAVGVPPGSVIQVVEHGYILHERLLRPARVGVAKGGDAAQGGNVDQQV